jgi:large subunit ribosomal protein L44e
MVDVPKTHQTFCKKYGEAPIPQGDTVQEGQDSLYAQGKRRYDRKESGSGGQTKSISEKRLKLQRRLC